MSNFSQPNSNDPLDIDLDLYPKGWKATSLGDLVEKGVIWIKNGYAQGTHNQDGQGIPHLRPFNISTNGQIDLSQIKYVTPPETDSPYRVYPKDVVFNNTNSEELVGKTAFFKNHGDYVLSNHMTIIRVMNENVLDAYCLSKQLLYLWQKGVVRSICRRHVNQASVSLARLNSIEIPIPPILEQRAIAQVLSTVREAIEASERVIAAAHDLKSSLMEHLFIYGPVPIDRVQDVPLKETEIGEMPKQWALVKLGEIAKVERGKFAHRPRNDPRFYGGVIPFIQTGDVSNAGSRIRTYTQTLNEKGLSVSRVFPKGTIVITIAANIGYTGILEFDSAFPDSLIGITPNRSANNVYLEYYLQTQRTKMDKKAPKGTQKNINIQFLKPWPIKLPPLHEQQEIVNVMSSVEERINAEENYKFALEAIFDSLLNHLMTGKIRVPIRNENL
jgi:type I restriction enzyme S subunit